MATLDIREHTSVHYAPRTYHNAHVADLTAAFAVDFTTAGERLTHKAAAGKYVAIDIVRLQPKEAAQLVLREALRLGAHVLNVAGNGIYTLQARGWTQERINAYVADTLAAAHDALRSSGDREAGLTRIVSGGQTGVDLAGLVAAHRLGIDAVATLPKGFVQRGADMVDRPHTREAIQAQILDFSARLSPACATTL